MGSWNETCALTRLPIRVGDPVVALTRIVGPRYKAQGSQKNALLFGLPLIGKYDDYGGIENLANPALVDFNKEAFARAGFYREYAFKREYFGHEYRLVANHRDTLWGLEHELKWLYYPDVGLTPSQAKSYDPAVQEKSTQAFKMTAKALETLGDRLNEVTLCENLDDAMDQLFGLIGVAFGEQKAWAAHEALRKHGLFAHQELILMHKCAYDAVLADFNRRAVHYPGQKGMALRSFIAQYLDDWLTAFQDARAKAKEMFAEFASLGKSDLGTQRVCERLAMTEQCKGEYLAPLTTPWTAPEQPLIGHYWGGAEPEAVLAAESRENILDYLVFQWARGYLRVDLMPAGNGSQCDESVLPVKVMKATEAYLRSKGALRSDFYGTLHIS